MLVYLLAQARHRLSRTVGTVAGVAIGVALFVALVAAGDGFVAAARQPLADIAADIVISRPDLGGDPTAQTTRGIRQPFGLASLTLAELDRLGELDDVSGVSGGLLLWDFSANSYQTLLGVAIEPVQLGVRQQTNAGPAQLAESIVEGRFLVSGDTGVVVVDQHFAAFFSLKPGGTVEIGETTFGIVGVVSAAGGNQTAGANFYVPLSDAQLLAGLDGQQVNQFYVRVGEAADVESVIAEVEAQLGDVSATTEQSIVSVMGGITEVSDRFASVAAVAALAGGLLLTAVTLNAAINLRATEVGVMKAVGWQARDVVGLFAAEGIVLSALGAAIGIALGWLTILVFAQVPIELPPVSASNPDLAEVVPSASFNIAANLPWDSAALATFSALVAGGFVSVLSAQRAARFKPADALRT